MREQCLIYSTCKYLHAGVDTKDLPGSCLAAAAAARRRHAPAGKPCPCSAPLPQHGRGGLCIYSTGLRHCQPDWPRARSPPRCSPPPHPAICPLSGARSYSALAAPPLPSPCPPAIMHPAISRSRWAGPTVAGSLRATTYLRLAWRGRWACHSGWVPAAARFGGSLPCFEVLNSTVLGSMNTGAPWLVQLSGGAPTPGTRLPAGHTAWRGTCAAGQRCHPICAMRWPA